MRVGLTSAHQERQMAYFTTSLKAAECLSVSLVQRRECENLVANDRNGRHTVFLILSPVLPVFPLCVANGVCVEYRRRLNKPSVLICYSSAEIRQKFPAMIWTPYFDQYGFTLWFYIFKIKAYRHANKVKNTKHNRNKQHFFYR